MKTFSPFRHPGPVPLNGKHPFLADLGRKFSSPVLMYSLVHCAFSSNLRPTSSQN